MSVLKPAHRLTTILATSALVLGLTGCGSSGGDASSSDSKAQVTTEGKVTKGLVSQGIVNAYAIREDTPPIFLDASRTNREGVFSLGYDKIPDGFVLLELTTDQHTEMKCDIVPGCVTPDTGDLVDFGEWFALPENFSLMGAAVPGQNAGASISPLSHLIIATASQLRGGLNTTNLSIASEWVESDFGLAFNPLLVEGADITDLSSHELDSAIELGILAASFYSQVFTEDWQNQHISLDRLDLSDTLNDYATLANLVVAHYAQTDERLTASLARISESSNAQAGLHNGTQLSIISHPQSSTTVVGEPVALRVSVSAPDSVSFQWYKGTQAIEGAREQTWSIPAARIVDQGLYSVEVTSDGQSMRSLSALVTVNESITPLSIAQHPSSHSLSPGQSVTLSVEAAGGSKNYTYAWRKGGSLIPSSNSPYLNISNAQNSDAGSYSVIVSDDNSSVTSSFANISVSSELLPVTIHRQPTDLTLLEGGNIALSVDASGGGYLSYQWRKDTQNLEGQHGTNLIINPASVSDSGLYDVIISNSQGAVTSSQALVTVLSAEAPITILTQPQSQFATEGQTVSLSVSASAGQQMYYQWYHNGQAIDGATSSRLTIDNVQSEHEGSYYVRISSGLSSEDSLAALVSLEALSSIDLSWEIPTQREDGSALSVNEINGYLIQYGTQPYDFTNSERINGGSQTTHSLNNIRAGSYFLRIATIDSDDILGRFSETIQLQVP